MDSKDFKWSSASTIESFAVRQTNASMGKCGYDAARKGLMDLGRLDKSATLSVW
jgi:hypothetical protein